MSNTSPITNLAIIGRLELLRTRFEKLWIPGAVESELRQLPNPTALAAIDDAFRRGWIAVRQAPDNANPPAVDRETRPGRGRSDRTGRGHVGRRRKAASRIGLQVTGILGVLLRAKQRGEIPLLLPELNALRTRARFFVGERLERELLLAADESS